LGGCGSILSRERAKIKKEVKTGINVLVKHTGKLWKIYYYPIGLFEDDLPRFSEFLEEVKRKGEEVSAIIPNARWVPASIVLGTSFQRVKWFAVITRMAGEAEG